MSITITPTTGGPQVNMANGNAAQVFDLLGVDFDGDCGETSAQDFLGRVLIALALVDTTADDTDGTPSATNTRWTDCGRRPGYLAEKLGVLWEVATWAVEHNTAVRWS